MGAGDCKLLLGPAAVSVTSRLVGLSICHSDRPMAFLFIAGYGLTQLSSKK
jgi:hypothetical protein